MREDAPDTSPPSSRSAITGRARAQQVGGEAALTAEQRILLALTLGRSMRALAALAKPR